MSTVAEATRRLARDARALAAEPVEGVAIRQDEKSALSFHVNMVAREGVYQGLPIHMHITFPATYPSQPPDVQMVTSIKHPNVFDSWICLDMLKEPEYYAKPYAGWSAAYDLSGILRQLYSFLLVDDKIGQMYGNTSLARISYAPCDSVKAAARALRCPCGFHTLPPAPQATAPRTQPAARAAGSSSSARSGSGSAAAGTELPPDVLRSILQMADAQTVAKISVGDVGSGGDANGEDELSAMAAEVQRAAETCCFYTKHDLSQEGLVLGYGVSIERHPGGRTIKSLSMAMDLLSHRAYTDAKVRRSAWNIPFEAFLPLAINARHAPRALALLDRAVAGMLPGSAPNDPAVLLNLLAQLMNSLVVEVLKQEGPTDATAFNNNNDDAYATAVPGCNCAGCTAARANKKSKGTGGGGGGLMRHMSDAALQGFCHLHHLLLCAATQRGAAGDALVACALRDVQAFVANPRSRSKEHCPDLGVLLVKLLLVPKEAVPWADFAPPFLRELLARQVRWLEKPMGQAFVTPWANNRNVTPYTADTRLTKTFQHAATGLRLVCLEAWFANALARPAKVETAKAELCAFRDAYSARSGAPPPAVFARFAAYARGVLAFRRWMQFLDALKLGVRNNPNVKVFWANVLCQATLDSARRQYHRLPPQLFPVQQIQYEAWKAGALPVAVISESW